ncbi:MAG: c-type cytochrome [Methylophaga sp.]|nr:c-type cytochrome [Methylophaga sp.]
MKKWVLWMLLMPVLAIAEPDMHLMAASCAACHGTNGYSQSEQMPSLAGLKTDYFVQRMLSFKAGEADSTVMHHHATGYTDTEIRQLAEYFAAQ